MNKFSVETASEYERHYSEHGFWRKVRRVAARMGGKVLYPALQLFYLLQSKDVPAKAKTVVIGALGYLILPVDLIPDFIVALGFTDDLTALLVALRTVDKYLTPEINRQAKEQTERMMNLESGKRNTENEE